MRCSTYLFRCYTTPFVELDLLDPHDVQGMAGEGLQLLRRFDEPLQHRVGIDLKHPCGTPDAQAFGQAREDPYDEVRRGPLAVKEGAEGLETIPATGDAQQLAPWASIGMAVGTEIASAHPAAIGTVRVRAEVRRGVDLAAAPPRGDEAGWRS